ncbi:MAG: hypothetical protein JST28_14000 [Acidobacteria bacterium]|nr:hypothetical protein [Acidobacteriota bacterium]
MRVSFRMLLAAGCCALTSLTCGFATDPSQAGSADIIVTAATSYEPLAALHGGERFPAGSQLLVIHNGAAAPLVRDFAATADASVSFDGKSVLFSAKKNTADPWQIWELNLFDRSVRQVIHSDSDAIRPFYLPGWRLVYARRAGSHFQMYSARLIESKTLDEIEGKGVQPVFPISFLNFSAIPSDVLADGRILFESLYPLGEGNAPELFRVYSDGSGVESYRCDHSTAARWGGRQIRSGDVVFTHGSSLSRFTSRLAAEERVTAPAAEYAGGVTETASGDWLLSARGSRQGKFQLKLWKPGASALRVMLARHTENLVEPVLVAPRERPRRHPSALHDWSYANLLALDARISRDGAMQSTPASVRLEAQDASGRAVSLGTAPVESDGSFFVETPADRAIRFVLLDAKGEVIRMEHGWFWIRRGEQRYCVGCHAGPEHAPENRVPEVLTRSATPVDLTSARGGN